MFLKVFQGFLQILSCYFMFQYYLIFQKLFQKFFIVFHFFQMVWNGPRKRSPLGQRSRPWLERSPGAAWLTISRGLKHSLTRGVLYFASINCFGRKVSFWLNYLENDNAKWAPKCFYNFSFPFLKVSVILQ